MRVYDQAVFKACLDSIGKLKTHLQALIAEARKHQKDAKIAQRRLAGAVHHAKMNYFTNVILQTHKFCIWNQVA